MKFCKNLFYVFRFFFSFYRLGRVSENFSLHPYTVPSIIIRKKKKKRICHLKEAWIGKGDSFLFLSSSFFFFYKLFDWFGKKVSFIKIYKLFKWMQRACSETVIPRITWYLWTRKRVYLFLRHLFFHTSSLETGFWYE